MAGLHLVSTSGLVQFPEVLHAFEGGLYLGLQCPDVLLRPSSLVPVVVYCLCQSPHLRFKLTARLNMSQADGFGVGSETVPNFSHPSHLISAPLYLAQLMERFSILLLDNTPLSEEVKIFLADDPSVLGALDQRLEPTEVSDLGVPKVVFK